jgi:hypothetical protein
LTPTETATPVPGLRIFPSQLKAGQGFSFLIRLTQDINRNFDYYVVADTQDGPYTFQILNRRVDRGIKALYTKVPGYKAPFEILVVPEVVLPANWGNAIVTFYTAAIEAGKVPPVSSLSELTPDTPYVIMMDKKTVTVAY